MRLASTVFSVGGTRRRPIASISERLSTFLLGQVVEVNRDQRVRTMTNWTIANQREALSLGVITLGKVADLLAGTCGLTWHRPRRDGTVNAFVVDIGKGGPKAICARWIRGKGWALDLASPGEDVLLQPDLRILS